MTTSVSIDSKGFSVEISAVTEIGAPAQKVWEIIAATPSYPEWNPFVVRLDGELETGSRIEVDMKPGDAKPQTIRPRIVEYTPGASLTWLGHIGFPGVLDGRHTFRVEPVTSSTSRLTQHEVLSGALTPLFKSMLTRDTPRAFEALNEALAKRATR